MTPFLAHDIEQEEGRRLTSYKDSLGVWTIGVGHCADAKEGQVVSDAWATGTLQSDINACVRALDKTLSWWRNLDDVRQDVMVQLVFQLGIVGLMGFVRTLAAIKRGDYAHAAEYMLESQWAKQTPKRANRMAAQIRSGVRAWQRPSPPPPSAPKAQDATPTALPGGPRSIA